MLKEDIWSKKYNAWYAVMYKGKKRPIGGVSKGKKGKWKYNKLIKNLIIY